VDCCFLVHSVDITMPRRKLSAAARASRRKQLDRQRQADPVPVAETLVQPPSSTAMQDYGTPSTDTRK